MVVSTTATKSISSLNDPQFLQVISRFDVGPELYEEFGEVEFRAHEFSASYKLSPYLYSIMAGPYVCFEGDQTARIPQRVFCRKSIAQHTEKIVANWFEVT